MNRIIIFPFIALLAGLVACTPKKKISTVKPEVKLASDIAILKQQLKDNSPAFKWIIAQGELNYDDGSTNVNVNITLRTRQDSLVWASANLLIEAVRIMVNKDSAILMNRLQKNYTVFPVSDLNKMFGINNLSLSSVQNLLRAIPPFEIDEKSKYEVKDGNYHLQNQQPTYREDITIGQNILRMTQYRYERNATEYVLVNYSDFKKVGNQLLPNKIDMEVHSPDKIHIILNVNDYSLQETDDAPFYIPQSYTQVK